jgi:hypothetical protein
MGKAKRKRGGSAEAVDLLRQLRGGKHSAVLSIAKPVVTIDFNGATLCPRPKRIRLSLANLTHRNTSSFDPSLREH